MLTDEMMRLIARQSIGAVATIASDGAPAVSPKATFLTLDADTLVFAHIRSPGTLTNIMRDPRVEVMFTVPFRRIGCRVRGRATYAPRDAADPGVWRVMEEHSPDLLPLAAGVVTIACGKAMMVASPSYDVGAEEDELINAWVRRFGNALGYEVRRS